MARPIKESLNYFPLDTGFFGDRKIKRLLKTFGGKGTTIYIFLLCEIYRENGYFLTWDDHYSEDIADTLGAGFSPSLVSEVLSLCLKIDLLDNKLFGSFSILTSAGIQKRYVSAKETINRKQYNADELLAPEYDLLSEISGSLTSLNVVKRRKTSFSAVTTLKGNERKVKEKKVKERKENKTKERSNVFNVADFVPPPEVSAPPKKPPARTSEIPDTLQTNDFAKAWSDWQQHRKEIRKKLTPSTAKQQLKKLEGLGEQRAVAAIYHSITNGWTGIFEPTAPATKQEKTNWLEDLQNLDLSEVAKNAQ